MVVNHSVRLRSPHDLMVLICDQTVLLLTCSGGVAMEKQKDEGTWGLKNAG